MSPLSDANAPAKPVLTPRKSSKTFNAAMKLFGRQSSKPELAVKEAVVAKEEVAAPPAPPAPTPTFFAVVHTFLDEAKAEAFFTTMGAMKEADFAAMAEKHHSLGFHNHSFMPTGPTAESKVLCVWECKADTTAEAFQTFIDGADGPAPGVFSNACYKVMPGAITPSSFFHDKAAATGRPAPSKGTFFWVHHSFKAGAAAGFWQMLQGMTPADFEGMADGHHKLGFHNHSFMPCAMDGPHAAICVWESSTPMSAETFQTFIDGPDGPGAGQTFENEVFVAMPGASLPSAHFIKDAPQVKVCEPCDEYSVQPDKCFGEKGARAMMWVTKMPDGRQASRIKVQKGFDWRASISPMLPGCPQWCPATHFGYLESGTMGIRMKDGTERVIKAGDTYLVPPGHLPIMSEDAVMIEFSQDTTYTQDIKK